MPFVFSRTDAAAVPSNATRRAAVHLLLSCFALLAQQLLHWPPAAVTLKRLQGNTHTSVPCLCNGTPFELNCMQQLLVGAGAASACATAVDPPKAAVAAASVLLLHVTG
jgi:uncharacterized membrane protein YhaH (DUF805 family)